MHYSYTHPPDSDTIQPITADIAKELTTPPPNTSRDIWLYELGRFLIQKTNAIIVGLFGDAPEPCSAATCPEMRASEWQYLCAVHDPPKSCAAIDYCCHTLDWASNSLASSKMFPSRLGLGSGGVSGGALGPDKHLLNQMKEIKNIFRRVYRIYAHAWFQHREMFWRVEGKTGLYMFFKTVCEEYSIIEPENYTIPIEAEGLEPETPLARADLQEAPRILQREVDERPEPAGNSVITMGDTTKRHRHTRSDLSSSAENIIQEEAEEEEQAQAEAVEGPNEAVLEKDEPHAEQSTGEEVPTPGIARTDTMRPIETNLSKEVKTEEDEDVTVVETTEDERTPIEGSYEPKTESIDPTETTTTVTEAAGQSVGD